MARPCKNKKRVDNRMVRVSILEDESGKFLPFCSFDRHKGILYPEAYRRCERKQCIYVQKYRSEGEMHIGFYNILFLAIYGNGNIQDNPER